MIQHVGDGHVQPHRHSAGQVEVLVERTVQHPRILAAQDDALTEHSGLGRHLNVLRIRTAVRTDMHRPPYLNAVGEVFDPAEIVFDEFHVLQNASAALDDVRRQEFFRAGAVMRAHGRGKRWLLLRRWATVRGSKRRELETLFAASAGYRSSRFEESRRSTLMNAAGQEICSALIGIHLRRL